jgi:hypothetical protein
MMAECVDNYVALRDTMNAGHDYRCVMAPDRCAENRHADVPA